MNAKAWLCRKEKATITAKRESTLKTIIIYVKAKKLWKLLPVFQNVRPFGFLEKSRKRLEQITFTPFIYRILWEESKNHKKNRGQRCIG